MRSLLLLFPALLCGGGLAMLALTFRADLASGVMQYGDRETWIGSGLMLACAIGAGVCIEAAIWGYGQ